MKHYLSLVILARKDGKLKVITKSQRLNFVSEISGDWFQRYIQEEVDKASVDNEIISVSHTIVSSSD
jgi:hypothetical protein